MLGFFVVDLDGAMIGVVTLDRRDAERPGHVAAEGGEAELGYLFLPSAWGRGTLPRRYAGPRLVRRRAAGRAAGALHRDRHLSLDRLAERLGSPRWRASRSSVPSSGSE